MTDVGTQSTFVDTQNSSLTIDDKTYTQLTDLTFDIDSMVTKHQLTDDTIDNVFSLYMNNVQGNMWVTTPEWQSLVTLTVDINGVRPNKSCTLIWTDQSGGVKTTTFDGQLKTLRPIDKGSEAVQLFFHLECDEKVVIT